MDVVLACIVGVPVYDPADFHTPANDNMASPTAHAGYFDERRRHLSQGYPEAPAIY